MLLDNRFDAQFFRKVFLTEDQALHQHDLEPIGAHAKVTDGPHGYHEVDEASPVAMLTARSAANWFATRVGADCISEKTHRANQRSSLEDKDVILGTRGTVGRCALVLSDVLPANIDQDVARITIDPAAPFSPEFVTAYLNCRFGQDHVERHSTGMVQQGINLAKVREIPIPVLSNGFQASIRKIVLNARALLMRSQEGFAQAETTLLNELGLHGWPPPEPLTYTRSAAAVARANRLDAEFAAPKVQSLLARLASSSRTIADVAAVRREKFRPARHGTFEYIEIGNLDGFGRCTSDPVQMAEAPSRATWHVRTGDVLTSTVRPIRRLSAIVSNAQDGDVCSSGFVVLHPTDVSSDALLTYLRLPQVCDLLHLFATASMYPALAEKDLLALPIPTISSETDAAVAMAVQRSREMLARSERLLEAAKHAVEIAIAESEAAALTFVAEQDEANAATA